jgi:hypothetical protein
MFQEVIVWCRVPEVIQISRFMAHSSEFLHYNAFTDLYDFYSIIDLLSWYWNFVILLLYFLVVLTAIIIENMNLICVVQVVSISVCC